jgi:hypothetical protein
MVLERGGRKMKAHITALHVACIFSPHMKAHITVLLYCCIYVRNRMLVSLRGGGVN